MIFISDHDASEILQPSEQALNLPVALVMPEFSAVLGTVLFAILFVRRYHLNVSTFLKMLTQTIAVVSLISYQSFRGLRKKATFT